MEMLRRLCVTACRRTTVNVMSFHASILSSAAIARPPDTSFTADILNTSLKYSYKCSRRSVCERDSSAQLFLDASSVCPSSTDAAHSAASFIARSRHAVGNKAGTRPPYVENYCARTDDARRNSTNNKPTPFRADKNHEFFITRPVTAQYYRAARSAHCASRPAGLSVGQPGVCLLCTPVSKLFIALTAAAERAVERAVAVARARDVIAHTRADLISCCR